MNMHNHIKQNNKGEFYQKPQLIETA